MEEGSGPNTIIHSIPNRPHSPLSRKITQVMEEIKSPDPKYLPDIDFDKGFALDRQCALCKIKFEEMEHLKVLPKCQHVMH